MNNLIISRNSASILPLRYLCCFQKLSIPVCVCTYTHTFIPQRHCPRILPFWGELAQDLHDLHRQYLQQHTILHNPLTTRKRTSLLSKRRDLPLWELEGKEKKPFDHYSQGKSERKRANKFSTTSEPERHPSNPSHHSYFPITPLPIVGLQRNHRAPQSAQSQCHIESSGCSTTRIGSGTSTGAYRSGTTQLGRYLSTFYLILGAYQEKGSIYIGSDEATFFGTQGKRRKK